MSSASILKQLEDMQARIKKYESCDYVVHIDDTLVMLRELRKIGFTLARGITLINTKASYWHVIQNGTPVFKVFVNMRRNTPRGEIIAVPHSITQHNLFSRRIQIERPELDNDFMPFRMWYGHRPK